MSPACMGAALHFALWVPNFGVQEHMAHDELTDAVFPHAYRFEDGYMHPGEAPGHGVEIYEALAAKYPYAPAQLPVARPADRQLWKRQGAGRRRSGGGLRGVRSSAPRAVQGQS